MPNTCKASPSVRRKPGMARLLAGVSIGAASLVLAATPLRAQAVNGTPTPQFGVDGISRSTPGLDAVFVTGSEALIDWSATDSGGVFLPEGKTLRFIYDGSSPYTVLNRVTDSAVGGPLSISGTVESSSLGKVWFYNAGGWVVGPKGVFNVGSLILTSLPITIDPASDTVSRLYGDKNEIRFGNALDSKSSVSIQSGAQINATLANSSYVALVAPRVDQAGTVRVNGSAAYVAASAATMTINGGLFDIIVDSGSDDDTGISHTGSTTWAANDGSIDTNHGVYLVAVPKNQAMTAVVSGRLGYDGATTAEVVDGSIVLSAGRNVSGGNILTGSIVGGDASLAISNLTVGSKGATNNLSADATGTITLDATTGSSTVHGSANLNARGNVAATIDNANSLVVEGDLVMASANGATAGNVTASVAGGGSLSVGGALILSSTALGAVQTDPLNGDALLPGSIGENATSGTASLIVKDGNVSALATSVQSDATSGVGDLSAGTATSGLAAISVDNSVPSTTRSVSLGEVTVSSSAQNGFFGLQQPLSGGDAVSGNASLAVNGGAYSSTSVSVYSDALTYSGLEPNPLDATAGAVSVSFANLSDIAVTGGVSVSNFASASDKGTATLGDVSLSYDNVDSRTADSGGQITVDSEAYGELVTPNAVSLTLSNNSRLDTLSSVVELYASGRFATGVQNSANVSFVSDASTLLASSLDITTEALSSVSGGNAVSGEASAVIRNGSSVTMDFGATVSSYARGGTGVDGGSGTAGAVGLTLADSTYNGDLLLESNGVAGRRTDNAGASGTGRGGSVTFQQSGKTAALTAGTVALSSLGQGGRPAVFSRTGLIAQAGDGASGIGGTTTFGIADGTFTTSKLVVSANGEGGDGLNVDGGTPGAGGLGQGGTARLNVTGGLISAPEITVAASGFGGDGAQAAFGLDGGDGGAGTGGSATASLTGGTIRTEFLLVEANGNKSITDPRFGGTSYFGNGGNEFNGVLRPGKGGTGTGGTSLMTVDGGSLLAMEPYGDIPPAVRVEAIGEGGPGGYAFGGSGGNPLYSGDGGTGLGGTATIRYLSGILDATYIGADASGLGGLPGSLAYGSDTAVNAASGGSGTGGDALFEIGTTLDQQNSLGIFRTVSVVADGVGSVGETGVIGGSGGNGTGGTAQVLGTGGKITLGDLTVSALGSGGNGGNGQIDGSGGRGGFGKGGLAGIVADGDGVDLSAQGPALLASGFGGFGGTGGVGADGNDVAGNGGDGGDGTGGEVSFLVRNLAKLSLTGFSAGSSFDASGVGGGGGRGGNAALTGGASLGNGGNGADGFGGTISVTAQSGGSLVFDSLSLTASGSGGSGGGRLGASTSGTPTPSLGGTGGSGQGGTIAFTSTDAGSSISADSLFASAQGLGGTGVDGAGFAPSGQSTDGSAGGNGTGGTFTLLADLEGAIALAAIDGSVSISVHGLGGDGGKAENAIGSSGASGGNGGASGSGTGGTVQFAANRQGVATVGRSGTSTISADGTGGLAGLGGNGAPATEAGTPGGNGGDTGLAQAGKGGAVTFGAEGGTLNFGALDTTAIGTTQFRNIAATGGSGPGGSGLPGSRSEVLPTGGTIAFSASDNASGGLGQINADAVTTDVTSNWLFVGLGFSTNSAAGGISLTNSSTAGGGGLHFGSFRGDASGFPATVDPAIDISVTAGAIVIDSDLTLLSSGNIALGLANGSSLTANRAFLQSDSGISISADGTGRFSGGSIELSSFGSIGVASTSCASVTCRPVEASGSLVIDSSGDFSLTGPVELAGLGSLEVYAAGDITGDAGTRYFSNGDVAVRAGNDATIRNITGANVIVEAGAIADGSYFYFDGLLTLGEVGGGGQFNASGSLDLNSGGSVRTLDGATFTAGHGIGVRSGNDITVGASNAFTANTGPSSVPDRIVFAAGGQTIDYSLDATDIATLSFGLGTTVDAGAGGVDLSGAAIDARSASFAGAFFRADVLDTLTPTSNRRDDGGRLDPECREGAICIGDIDVTGFVSIGGGDFVPLDITATGTITGDTVGLRATGTVTLGGLENTAQITAVDDLSITSLSGDIALLGNSGLTGGTVRLAAAGNLTGTGNIEATRDDIGLSIGGDIDASALIAARELTTAADAGGETEDSFKALGALRIGTLSLGTSANISASGEIHIGALSLGGLDGVFSSGTALQIDSSAAVRNLSLTAGTAATFGNIATDGDLTIEAQSITGTSADAGGLLSLTATDLAADVLQSAGDLNLKVTNEAALGSVTSTGGSVFIDPALLTFDSIASAGAIQLGGGTIIGGTVDAATRVSITATDALSLTSVKSGTGATLGAASLAVGDLSVGTDLFVDVSGQVDLTGTTGVGGNASIIAGTLNTQAIDVTGNLDLSIAGIGTLAGGVTTGGDFFSSADSLGFDTIAATGTATFEGGAINGTSVTADGALSASLTGSATLGSASAGSTLGISATSLSATGLSAGGDLTLTITDTAALGTVSSTGGSVSIDPALLTFDAITANKGITLSGGTITGGLLDAGTSIGVTATGALTFSTAKAGTTASLDADLAKFDSLASIGLASITGGAVDGGSLTGGGVSIDVTGSVALASASSTGDLAINGASLVGGVLGATGNVRITLTGNGDLGTTTVAGSLYASGLDLSFAGLAAQTVELAGRSVTGGTIDAVSTLLITADGAVDLDRSTSGSTTEIYAGSLVLPELVAGDLALGLSGDALLGTVSATGTADVRAGTLSFSSFSADGPASVSATTITGGSARGGSHLTLTATDAIELASASAAGTLRASGASITADGLSSDDTLIVESTGAVAVGSLYGEFGASVAAGDFTFGRLASASSVTVNATSLAGGAIDALGSASVTASGAVLFDSASAGLGLSVTAKSLTAPSLAAGGDLTLTIADTAALGTVSSTGGFVSIDPALLTFDAITANKGITLSGGTITGGTLDAGTSIGVTATGALTLTSATSGTTLSLGADSLQAGALDAGGDLSLSVAKGALLTGPVKAGGDFSSTAASLAFGTINAGAAAIFGGGSIDGDTVTAGGAISASLGGAAILSKATSGTTLGIGADSVAAGELAAGTDLSVFANGAIALGTGTAGGTASLNAATSQFTSLASTGLAAIAGGTVDGGTLQGGAGVSVDVSGDVKISTVNSGADLLIRAADLDVGTLATSGNARLVPLGNATLGTATVGGSLYVSGLDLAFTSLSGQSIELATRSVTGGTVDATSTLLVSADGAVRLTRSTSGSTSEIFAGSLELDELSAADLNLGIGGTATLGTVTASGIAELRAGSLSFSAINATGRLTVSAGDIAGGTVVGGANVSLSANGAVSLASVGAAGTLAVSGTSIAAEGLSANDSLSVISTGTVKVTALYGETGAAVQAGDFSFARLASAASIGVTAGTVSGGVIEASGDIALSSTGAVSLDSASAGLALAITAQSLSAPALTAGQDLVLAITDTATLGTVTSTTGSVLIDPALLTFDTIAAANSITLSGGTITGGSLDAGTSIDVSATGDLTLDLADAGTTLSLSSSNLLAGTLRSNGATSVTAADLASITTAVNSGGGISIAANRFSAPLLQANTGNIALAVGGRADLTNIAAFGGDLTINAGTLRFAAASALGAVRLSGADIAGTTVTSGTSTNLNASIVADIGTVTAGTSATLGGLAITVDSVSAGTFTDFDGRSITVGETAAATTAFVDARDFTFDKLAAGDIVEILTSGNTNGGTVDAGTTLRIAARGDVSLDDAKAGGTITIGAANIAALTISGDAGLSLTATDAIDLGTVKVLGAFDLSGASLVLGTSNSGLDSTFSLTGNATIGTAVAGLASTGQNLVQIVVQALANSYTGGTLVPVFDVVQGQTIRVSSSTNDLWSAGFLPRFSDGDGLVAFRLATAQDDSGIQPGTQIGAAFGNLAIGNFSAPFGALVGQIGNQNVLLGANGTVTAPATGTLSVGYWDSNAGDNTGSIAFTFATGSGGGGTSNPANLTVTTGGNLTVGSASASSAVTLDAAGALKLDSADAGTALSLMGNSIDAGTLKAGTDITLAITGASVIGSATAGGSFSADIGALDFSLIDAAGAVDIASLAGVGGGDIRSGASIVVDASGSIVIRDANAATDLSLTSGTAGDITARTLAAGGAIGIEGHDVSLASATAGGSFTLSGIGAVELGTASAGDALSVTSQTLTFTRLSSAGQLSIDTTGDVTGGDIVATGTMRIDSGSGRFTYGTLDGGEIAITAGSASGGSIRTRAGNLDLGVAGDASIGAIAASGNVAINARDVASTTISAGGSFNTTNRTMAGTSISAGQNAVISSQGNIALSGLAGRTARIRSAGIVNITGLQLSGAIFVSADAVGLDALGNLEIGRIAADNGNVDVSAEGSITGNTIDALGDINVLARNGGVELSHLSAGYSDVFGAAVRPQGTVASGAVGQGSINIAASGDIAINDVADAANAFTMNAGGVIRLNGLATGATMDLTSADLEIGAAGRLGETMHADAISLRNTGQGPLRLGDNITSTTSGYAISQAEFARIRSRGNLTIRATQALLVGDLAVVAQAGTTQGQVGETGTLSLRSGGLATFLGALSMSNAAGNSLTIDSQSGVFLDAATGSIRLLEGDARAGTLAISGSGIAMVTRSALDDISQLTDTALITDRLGLNDGVTDGRTLVEADAIQLRSDREVYIQNTSLGTRLDDRRGLVANSLRIGSRDGSQLDIVINGIVNGQTGVDAIEQITFDEAFTDLSSVNGCVIASSNTCNKLPFEIIELRDLVEEVLKTDPEDNALQVTDSFTKTTLIELNQIAPAGFEPLIDEPVTGTGNDDLLGEGRQDGE